ncbi:MAG: mechanosensitive ion channel family protein [Deltaproteobacteria bacterium]|nr:mechanosensitive ion channel family protein [Deltaproteobacteria bacterium]
MTEINAIFNSLAQISPLLQASLAVSLLIFVAIIANFLVKKVLLRILFRILKLVYLEKDTELTQHLLISRLTNMIPAFIIIIGISLVPHLPVTLVQIIKNVASAFIILTFSLALSELLNLINLVYMHRAQAHKKPIKGYLQVLKILIALVTIILVISTLIDKSPVILLSGLGAVAAVMMLVFQDTLLSLVASIQISSGNIIRVGDWIEMPQLNADGEVIDIALHTVKVQNWDLTTTTIPTRRLVSETFKNWRGMQESGGRRIKRAVYIDQNSIHFLTAAEKLHLKKFSLLEEYLQNKEQELTEWNQKIEGKKDPINARQLTNLGTFRAYLKQFLTSHEEIHPQMTLLVRQLAPGATGLPLEIYCFTNTTVWREYERIQADIFDHLYAIMPEFRLRAFQQPGGHDLLQIKDRVL